MKAWENRRIPAGLANERQPVSREDADITTLNIEEPAGRSAPRGFALFALGFRPFFLLAGIAAVGLVAAWVLVYLLGGVGPAYYGPAGWHSHEMLFGYTVAVIAGFLLTAVGNWTDMQTAKGGPLVFLAGLWLAGRLVPFLSGVLPGGVIALVDIAFLPALALVLAIPLVRRRQVRNLVFVLLLAGMTVANALIHGEVLGLGASAHGATVAAVYLVILMIGIMGGRVIPFFTERGLPSTVVRRNNAVEAVSMAALVAAAVAEVFFPDPRLVGGAAALAAAAHSVRLYGWFTARVWSVPLLWVLHLGYAWLIIGLVFRAAAAAGLMPPGLGLHGLTAGTIGVVTLGMMARVALGHTGRPLQVTPLITAAFGLINLAVFVRVVLPLLAPDAYRSLIAVSGIFWAMAFAAFVAVYTPILSRPRVDGRQG